MTRQCMVAAILHRQNVESSAFSKRNLQQSKTLTSINDESAEGAKCEDLEKVTVGDDQEKFFQVGSQLPPQERQKLIEFLRKNMDVFAWNAYEALGVDLSFICHHLNVNPSVTPKKQSPRRSSNEHSDAIKDEMTKLKQAGVIKEVFYPEQLANTVVVKKKSGKWLVCVDFMDLNKACLKDPFPMLVQTSWQMQLQAILG